MTEQHYLKMQTRAELRRLQRRARNGILLILLTAASLFTGMSIERGFTEANRMAVEAEE